MKSDTYTRNHLGRLARDRDEAEARLWRELHEAMDADKMSEHEAARIAGVSRMTLRKRRIERQPRLPIGQ